MMISTGLPELSSDKDLNYLRETLVSLKILILLIKLLYLTIFLLLNFQVLDLSEDDALRHFRSKFEEALQNSWKTSLNWFSHNISRNNNK